MSLSHGVGAPPCHQDVMLVLLGCGVSVVRMWCWCWCCQDAVLVLVLASSGCGVGVGVVRMWCRCQCHWDMVLVLVLLGHGIGVSVIGRQCQHRSCGCSGIFSVGNCTWHTPPFPLNAPLLNIHKMLPKRMRDAVLSTQNG